MFILRLYIKLFLLTWGVLALAAWLLSLDGKDPIFRDRFIELTFGGALIFAAMILAVHIINLRQKGVAPLNGENLSTHQTRTIHARMERELLWVTLKEHPLFSNAHFIRTPDRFQVKTKFVGAHWGEIIDIRFLPGDNIRLHVRPRYPFVVVDSGRSWQLAETVRQLIIDS